MDKMEDVWLRQQVKYCLLAVDGNQSWRQEVAQVLGVDGFVDFRSMRVCRD